MVQASPQTAQCYDPSGSGEPNPISPDGVTARQSSEKPTIARLEIAQGHSQDPPNSTVQAQHAAEDSSLQAYQPEGMDSGTFTSDARVSATNGAKRSAGVSEIITEGKANAGDGGLAIGKGDTRNDKGKAT